MPASHEQRNELMGHQVEELLLYRDGPVSRTPSANLVRRNLLMRVGKHGESEFTLTEFGRAALGEYVNGRLNQLPEGGNVSDDTDSQTETEQSSPRVTFLCAEPRCDFEPTTDVALSVDHEQETGHKMTALPGDPIEILGRIRRDQHQGRVEVVLGKLPVPPEEYVVYDASDPGIRLIEVIEHTADIDLVRAFDRYVKMPRGYATVGFLRQLFAVTG